MSVDIKTTYGAAGNGQLQTLTVSFSPGSNSLTVFSNTFSGGDVGKAIAVSGWLSTVNNPHGVVGRVVSSGTAPATIQSVGSFGGVSQTLVLTGLAATQTLASAPTLIEWGTDDTGAFSAFNTAQAGNAGVVLTIPAGRYLFASASVGSSTPIGNGVLSLTVNGSGSPILSDLLGGGNGYALNRNGVPLINDNTQESLVKTVGAGSAVLHMITPSDASKYSANTWAWMSGYDTQGFGDPPNPYWSEFVFITAIDAVAGTVTLQTPLKNAYKSNWPKWGFGSPTAFSLGGPATLYVISQDWNATQVWNGVGFASEVSGFNATMKSITLNNTAFPGSFAVNPSFQQECIINTVTGTIPDMELDKGVETFKLTNATCRGFNVQSPSPYNVILDTVTVQAITGNTTKNWTMINCSIPSGSGYGPTFYGLPSETLTAINTVFAGQTIVSQAKEPDLTGAGGYSCVNGLITRLKAGGSGGPPAWAIPGKYFFLGGSHNFENAPWRCLDVWDDGTTLYILTDQTGGFTSASPSAFGCPPILNFVGCSGCDDGVSWSNIIPNRPMFTQWNKAYIGNLGAADPTNHLVKVAGNVVSVAITVAPGYSAGTFTLDPFVFAKPGNAQLTWTASVDLTVAGKRTITPSGVTGRAGADNPLVFPNGGNIWLLENQITPFMTGAVGAGSVTLEILTDQAFNPAMVMPLRFGLHA